MRDLYFDDIENKAYSDKMILEDLWALIKAGQREGPLLDYKSDLSHKDNWPSTVAAFANTFGGLIVFGVEGKNDQPRRLTGFDPKGVEVKTKLTSMVIDRIHPRPDFSVRVVTYDQDPKREVALLRVAEGRNPPYMHSKDSEHRVYIRMGAQKAEADYLQLSSLLEKRKRTESQAVIPAADLFGSDSQLHIPRPVGSNQVSPNVFKFVLSPRNMGVGVRLNFETERQFKQCIVDVSGKRPSDGSTIRSRNVTVFPVDADAYLEQRFALAARGGIGFVSFPGITTEKGLFFVPADFCHYLLNFLSISSLFYERTIQFFGPCVLHVALTIAQGVNLFGGFPTSSQRIAGTKLFHPPLETIRAGAATEIEVAMSPISGDRLQDYLEAVMIDVVRPSGSVLVPEFRTAMQALVDDAVKRLASARAA
jgi:schlafen family protein